MTGPNMKMNRKGFAKADDGVAARHTRQPFPRDLGRSVPRDHPAHQGSEKLHVAAIEIAISDLLDDDASRHAAFA